MLKFLSKRFSNPNTVTIRESLKMAMSEEMKRDEKVFLMGEEVA